MRGIVSPNPLKNGKGYIFCVLRVNLASLRTKLILIIPKNVTLVSYDKSKNWARLIFGPLERKPPDEGWVSKASLVDSKSTITNLKLNFLLEVFSSDMVGVVSRNPSRI